MTDYAVPMVDQIAGQEAQDEFAAVMRPIVDSLPAHASPELLGNIIAACVTEFVADEGVARWVCAFAADVAVTELRRHAKAVN
jgi:hypothetical protein